MRRLVLVLMLLASLCVYAAVPKSETITVTKEEFGALLDRYQDAIGAAIQAQMAAEQMERKIKDLQASKNCS